jgi:hypothetical protein
VKADEFFREVDEAVRQERWLKLWKHYGGFIIGAVLAIVVGTAAGVAWREYRSSTRLSQAAEYAQAIELLRQDRSAEAADAFAALAEEADSGYAVLARLRAAEARAEAGDPEAKLETLTRLAESDAAPVYRELGRLLAAQQQLGQGEPGALAQQLAELTGPGEPWRYSALELRALAQMRAGETLEARRTLTALVSEPGAPANLAGRASELLEALGGPPDAEAPEQTSEAEGANQP